MTSHPEAVEQETTDASAAGRQLVACSERVRVIRVIRVWSWLLPLPFPQPYRLRAARRVTIRQTALESRGILTIRWIRDANLHDCASTRWRKPSVARDLTSVKC